MKLSSRAEVSIVLIVLIVAFGLLVIAQPAKAQDSNVVISKIHYNAEENDWNNPNDEYVVLSNATARTIELSGWTLSDEANHVFTFPNGFTLPGGKSVTVYSGSGTNTGSELYWKNQVRQVTKNSELAYSIWNPKTHKWTDPKLLTHNRSFETGMSLSRAENEIVLTYVSEADNNPFGANTKNIKCTWWNGKNWTIPKNIVENTSVLSIPDVEVTASGKGSLIFLDDADENLRTVSDREIQLVKYSKGRWRNTKTIKIGKKIDDPELTALDNQFFISWIDEISRKNSFELDRVHLGRLNLEEGKIVEPETVVENLMILNQNILGDEGKSYLIIQVGENASPKLLTQTNGEWTKRTIIPSTGRLHQLSTDVNRGKLLMSGVRSLTNINHKLVDMKHFAKTITIQHIQVTPPEEISEDNLLEILQNVTPKNIPEITPPKDIPELIPIENIRDIISLKKVPENVRVKILEKVSPKSIGKVIHPENISDLVPIEDIPDIIPTKHSIAVATPEDLPDVINVAGNIVAKVDTVRPDKPITIWLENTRLQNLKLDLKETVKDVKITYKKIKKKPPELPEPPGFAHVYEKFNVSVPPDKIERLVDEFSIPENWLKRKGVDRKDIKVLRFKDGKWIPIHDIRVILENGLVRTMAVNQTGNIAIGIIPGIFAKVPAKLPDTVEMRENIVLHVSEAGPKAPLDIEIENSKVGGIRANFSKVVKNLKTVVEKLKEKPPTVPEPPGLVRAYTNININKPEASIENAAITFWVLKEWLNAHGIPEESVLLLRYHEGAWENLPTKLIGENGTHFKYKAETSGFSTFAITAKAPALQEKPLKMRIGTEVEGTILQYRENLTWSEEKFSNITKRKEKFRSSWIENFKGKFNQGKDFEVKFEESSNSTILSCDIHNEIWKSGKEYTAVFSWFLNPLGLDLLGNDFKEHKWGLSWKGKIDGVDTSIVMKFPPRESIYGEWNHPNGHCHAHVWWKVKQVRKPEKGLPWALIGGVIVAVIVISGFVLYRRK